MGCFPGAGGRWWGCSEGCTVFTHWGLYLLAIVPIKLRNKPAENSVANNIKCLFLILASTCLLSFITSGLGLALLGFKRRVESRSALESVIFPGLVTPRGRFFSQRRQGHRRPGPAVSAPSGLRPHPINQRKSHNRIQPQGDKRLHL